MTENARDVRLLGRRQHDRGRGQEGEAGDVPLLGRRQHNGRRRRRGRRGQHRIGVELGDLRRAADQHRVGVGLETVAAVQIVSVGVTV